LAARAAADHQLFGRGDLVLCGVSGGPDSSAMLHALALLRRRIGHELVAVGVDHGLRSGAAAELQVAARLAEKLGVSYETRRVRVPRSGNLQMQARQQRLAALQNAAARHGAQVVATGHTADDRAETVVLRLLRGTGPRGLAALPPRAPSPVAPRRGRAVDLVRPLLAARRSDVLVHLERHGVRAASDPSNRDRRFLRVRVRHEVLPLLEQLSPRIVEHLCALADMVDSGSGVDPAADLLAGAAPLPLVLADAGTPVQDQAMIELCAALGRSQRQAIARAVRLRKGGARIRVAGGRDLELRFFAGTPVLLLRK
jgi:tRNA(Ile)-lysidine synthase